METSGRDGYMLPRWEHIDLTTPPTPDDVHRAAAAYDEQVAHFIRRVLDELDYDAREAYWLDDGLMQTHREVVQMMERACTRNGEPCKICNGKARPEGEPLYEVPDGMLDPDEPTEVGGFSVWVHPACSESDFEIDRHAFIEIGGIWKDGIESFGGIIPVRYCPWCGREIGGGFFDGIETTG